MTTINADQITNILEKHRKWLVNEDGGQVADLRNADLSDADLRNADLRRVDLRRVDLRNADLSDADLRNADLRRVDLRSADLRSADLRRVDLRNADLSDADLRGADLRGIRLPIDRVPVIKDIHQSVLQACSAEGALNMDNWHTCGTTHCRAGWVVTLAGEGGKLLESIYDCGTAAAMIYMVSDPTMEKIPNWYASNKTALEDMKRLAGASYLNRGTL